MRCTAGLHAGYPITDRKSAATSIAPSYLPRLRLPPNAAMRRILLDDSTTRWSATSRAAPCLGRMCRERGFIQIFGASHRDDHTGSREQSHERKKRVVVDPRSYGLHVLGGWHGGSR